LLLNITISEALEDSDASYSETIVTIVGVLIME